MGEGSTLYLHPSFLGKHESLLSPHPNTLFSFPSHSMNFEHLMHTDPEAFTLLTREMERQESSLELIPSECIASLSVIEALGSPLTNKYSEWYPWKRYYGGNEVIDMVENLAIARAKQAFPWVVHVNVQPYSWSPANFAVYNALCNPQDTTMGMSLTEWWHLTHGWKASATGKYFSPVLYGLRPDGYIDLEAVERLAHEHRPKLIWVGATAYSREFPFAEFARISDSIGAYLAADISHISGLVIAGAHESPAKYAHIITTTTHKTMRGPRGAMIMVTERGLEKDSELPKKIDASVFPWLQWGPHNHQTLAIAVALGEALTPEFREMNHQIVRNAHALSETLMQKWFTIVTGGTSNHLILADVGYGRGIFMQEALDHAGITLNKNTIPHEPSSPFYPSGIRMGTPIMTMRGMREKEMQKVWNSIAHVAEIIREFQFRDEEKKDILANFRNFIHSHDQLKQIREEVRTLCKQFPIYSKIS